MDHTVAKVLNLAVTRYKRIEFEGNEVVNVQVWDGPLFVRNEDAFLVRKSFWAIDHGKMLIFIGWIEILLIIHFCWLFIFLNHSSLNYLFIWCFSTMCINSSNEEPISVILHILYCRFLIWSFLSLLSLWILVLIWSRNDSTHWYSIFILQALEVVNIYFEIRVISIMCLLVWINGVSTNWRVLLLLDVWVTLQIWNFFRYCRLSVIGVTHIDNKIIF